MPVSFLGYNQNMGGVPSYIPSGEKKGIIKWYIKTFRRLLNATILKNLGEICHKEKPPVIYSRSGTGSVS
jgi:hypothetical protein